MDLIEQSELWEKVVLAYISSAASASAIDEKGSSLGDSAARCADEIVRVARAKF